VGHQVAANGDPDRNLRLVTLGAVKLTDADGRDLAPRQHKLLALLTYLARKATRPVPREELAALIWGERTDDQARGSLRQALFQLRRIVGDALEVEQGTIALKAGALDTDVSALEADVASGRYRDAALRWHGDFLAGADDAGGEAFRTWLDSERTYLRQLLARAVEQLSADATARGAWSEAAAWADRWVNVLPLDERPHRRLVEALSLGGRSAEAVARHAAYVARVRAELGAEPSADFLRLGSQLEQRARASAPGARASRDAAATHSPDMVGREFAFTELTDAWRDARRGQRVAVAIEGDVGVGKTRLVDEFLRVIEAQRGDAVVLRARAYATEREVPLSTARELLSQLRDAPGVLGAPRSALAEVATVVPALGERVKELPAPTGRPGALEGAVAQVVDDVAAEVPVVMLVDDLPRADAESRRLVASLARRTGTEPVLLVMTTGLAESDRVEMPKDVRALRSVKLKPLEVAEVEAMLSSMVDLAQEERRFVAEQLVAETGGYPFDVVEIVRTLVDDGLLVRDAAGCWRLSASARDARLLIPPAVRDAIRQRLARLSGSAREVLEAAATVGGSFDALTIAELLGRDTTAAVDGLDELVAHRVLRKASTAAGFDQEGRIRYEIAMAAARRVSLEQLSADRRATLRAANARRTGTRGTQASERATATLVALDERYTIGAVLAEGRTVTTYEARDIRDGRDVELHVVRVPAVTSAERFLTTFERVAALKDPRIAPVVDFGATSDALFYANVRADGPSLRERLARERPLPVDEAVQIATDVGRALVTALAAGIVHGDLRPKHVTVTLSGAVLGGLGLVEALGTQSVGAGPDGTGVTIGAPAYLSPEQLTGEAPADPRSDIYSLGCILYEMLAGELPFGGSHQALLARKLTQPAPSVRERRDSVPGQLDRMLRKCLARVPADRYGTMAEVLDELRKVREAL
jgi:DNA-binding SARP family transcriptional activator